VLKEEAGAADASAPVAKAPQLLAKCARGVCVCTYSHSSCVNRYCDLILRKGPKHISDEAEMERTLDDVVSLFKYA
jgi:hypothetical protein